MTIATEKDFFESLDAWFEDANKQPLSNHIQTIKRQALQIAKEQGVPRKTDELWRQTDLSGPMSRHYQFNYQPQTAEDAKHLHSIQTEEANTRVYYLSNGAFERQHQGLKTFDNGLIIGSIMVAYEQYPELVETYLNKAQSKQDHFFKHINTALFTDGLFVYVPKNVKVEQTIQLTHALGYKENSAEFIRNLIILEEGSELCMTQCEHSFEHEYSFSNTVSEFYVKPNAQLKLYKVQNINENAYLYHKEYFMQWADSHLQTHKVIFNGGWVRNETYNALQEAGAQSDIQGLYTCDKGQRVENYILVDHLAPHCESNESFKGILDDFAKAVFNGHIIVHPNAQKTLAYQNNNNIVLTDKAKVHSKPFLEIYADDVKCSHGATLGQLDETAMFYLRQRGIGLESARLLLMYAFAAEIITPIHLPHLRHILEDMIKRRLRGELSSCNECVLLCSHPEEFKIDIDINFDE